MSRAIITFTKTSLPYGWLGNMSRYPVEHEQLTWPTTEHLFQALRFDARSLVREEIRRQKSPMSAKMLAKSYRYDWIVQPRSAQDLQQMSLVLRLKYDQHADVRRMLQETGDAELVEDVTARQSEASLFWGMALPRTRRVGQNWLGRLWMEIRERQLNDDLSAGSRLDGAHR